MKSYLTYLSIICLLLTGCARRFKFTVKVCNDSLYSEVYNINPAGVDADYLTDSVNFRMYVGTTDNEHENFNYTCNGDSLIIKKVAVVDTTGIWRVMETRTYSLSELKKKKVFE